MKYLACSALLLFFISCAQKQPKEKLCLVNDQNDGWNAFSIILRDDNTYKIEDTEVRETGNYTISDNIIFLDCKSKQKDSIKFDRRTFGGISNVRYISKDRVTIMRVVSDSLFYK
jgi:hypothetical protein